MGQRIPPVNTGRGPSRRFRLGRGTIPGRCTGRRRTRSVVLSTSRAPTAPSLFTFDFFHPSFFNISPSSYVYYLVLYRPKTLLSWHTAQKLKLSICQALTPKLDSICIYTGVSIEYVNSISEVSSPRNAQVRRVIRQIAVDYSTR